MLLLLLRYSPSAGQCRSCKCHHFELLKLICYFNQYHITRVSPGSEIALLRDYETSLFLFAFAAGASEPLQCCLSATGEHEELGLGCGFYGTKSELEHGLLLRAGKGNNRCGALSFGACAKGLLTRGFTLRLQFNPLTAVSSPRRRFLTLLMYVLRWIFLLEGTSTYCLIFVIHCLLPF